MNIWKQQLLFLLIALVSVAFFCLYPALPRILNNPEQYFQLNGAKIVISVLINYALISFIYLLFRKTFITIFFSQFIFLLIKETFVVAPWLLKFSVLSGVAVCITLIVFLYRKEQLEKKRLFLSNALLSLCSLGVLISANFSNNFSQLCQQNQLGWLCEYRQAFPNTKGDWIGDHLTIQKIGFIPFFFSKSMDSLNTRLFNTENIPEATIKALYTPYSTTMPVLKPEQQPNIVMIMSEAHWDARQLGKNIPQNITPTLDRYQTSSLLSPSFGGGTANVEFEVLTSLNIYLNHNELMYVSKLKRPTYSLATYLNSLGYDTTAMHNSGKFFYNRNSVYQNLGFNRFTSLENMTSAQDRAKYINQAGWANDDLLYQSIRNQLKHTEQPQFIYAITVENHFNYNDDRYGMDHFNINQPELSESSKRQLNTYLTGLQRADQHVEKLLQDLKQQKRPTIVIFFGDHLPNLGQVYDDFHFFASAQEKAEKKDVKFFSTPLAVWSNYPIDRSLFQQKNIAAHFLAPKVLTAAQLPLPPYYQFIQAVNACYSAIHQTGVELKPECKYPHPQLLNQYKDLNMDVLNGKNHSYQLLTQKAP
ncbi:LTA synthase family protein [Acinetobacter tandoii]|uniref:Sulfatase N-terminal domain-containing protein n=1 Tax=Acinetobacter tandoii DSM 14970 = CIP 107469 TaxID=1120927 RepID=R9B8L1_9GAMM|nr:LTA synthase family protein [Acinetobacter tandoii]EOR10884.1 hypothetical protein I593_00534 [Acinetobacter tandoii DSM 14970 = CIP 107469]